MTQIAVLFSWTVSTVVVHYLYEINESGREFLDSVI